MYIFVQTHTSEKNKDCKLSFTFNSSPEHCEDLMTDTQWKWQTGKPCQPSGPEDKLKYFQRIRHAWNHRSGSVH